MNKTKLFKMLVWFEVSTQNGIGGISLIYTIEANGKHKAAAKLAKMLYDHPDTFRSIRTLN